MGVAPKSTIYDRLVAYMDIVQLQQQAGKYLERCHYSDAIALYQQCIDANPTAMSNYWHLGLALLLQDSELEAQAVWLSALGQQTPEKMEVCLVELLKVLSTEASRLLQSGNVELAERIYGQILELDSNQAEAYYNLGIAIAHRGDLDEAVACWQKAIDLQPDLADAYQNQGCVLQKLGKFAEAIPCYLKALEIKPDGQINYNLGICFCQEGKLDEAVACFQSCIQLQPYYTQAYGDLGYALLEKGKLEEAYTCFQSCIQLQPALALAYCSWSDALTINGKSDPAITRNARFLKALQERADSDEVYFYLGNALASESKFDRAIACYKKALQIQPDKAEIYLDLGKALAQQGNLQEAIDCYHKELELNPDSAELYFYLGNALLKNGKLNEAIKFYQKNLEIQPESANARCNLGIALAQRGNTEEAIACFQKSIEINPDLSELIYNVTITLCQQGKLDSAIPCFQNLLPVPPPNGFYESTWDWAVTHNLEKSNYINIYPENQIYLTPPITLDSSVHFSFRFGTKVTLPASFVAVVPEGRYWLNRTQTQTAIITPDNQLLADVSPDFPVLSPGHPDKHPSKHLIFSSGKLPPVHSIDGTVAVLSGLLNDVYFHWLFDVLPRIELLRLSGIDIDCIDYFLINSRFPFQKETLEALGIPEPKRLETYKYPHLQATTLVVPSFPGSIAWMPKWSCDFLKSTFLNKTATNKIERIYISRANVANRRIVNEDDVINCLNKFGFKSVTLESMSVTEQAALMADAKVVIAPHGGGLTNTVFCTPGTKVIEIFSPNFVYPCYWLISNIIGLKYYYLLGEVYEGLYLHNFIYNNSRFEDIFVNIDSLLKVMKLAEVV